MRWNRPSTRYGRHRLLTFDRDPATREPTVEVAHEALLGAWERLRGWIEEAREDVRMHRRLSDAAREWERNRRESSFLLAGSRLDQFESWGSATNLALGLEERGYLSASVARRDEERAAEAARNLRERTLERRSVKRLRALVVALTAAALVAGTLTAIALNRNASAQRASSLATGRELLAGAAKNLEVDRELAILLALEALRTTQGVDGTVLPEAEEFLRRAAPAVAIDTTSILGSAIRENAGWVTPDGTTVALVGDDGSVGVWDLRNGSRILGRPSPDDSCGANIGCPDVFHVSLSDDAHLMATGDGEGLAHVWDLDSGREVMTASTHARPQDPGWQFRRDSTFPQSWPSARTDVCSRPWGATRRFGCGRSRRAHGCGPWPRRGRTRSVPPASVLMGPDSSCAPGRGLPVSWTSPPGRRWSPRAATSGAALHSAPTAPGSPSQ